MAGTGGALPPFLPAEQKDTQLPSLCTTTQHLFERTTNTWVEVSAAPHLLPAVVRVCSVLGVCIAGAAQLV